jgi:8-oxo-dGTP diphosphatase
MRVAVDGVIFGYDYLEKDLKVLLIRRKYEPFTGSWALCGGFCLEDESIDDAIQREVKEETGVSNVFLEQLYTFGSVERDPRERIVSIAYYGLVNPSEYKLHASTDATDAVWFSLKTLDYDSLPFDHSKIIQTAIERLKNKVTYQPIGFELLPETFTFPQLQSLYETLLEISYDRRNFRRKFLKLDILVDTGETVNEKKGKLYRFDQEKYKQKLNEGFYFDI